MLKCAKIDGNGWKYVKKGFFDEIFKTKGGLFPPGFQVFGKKLIFSTPPGGGRFWPEYSPLDVTALVIVLVSKMGSLVSRILSPAI